MTQKIKVMTIVGTRPELIKLSRIIVELDKYTQHILVHSGQNYDYELNGVFFEDMAIRKPDYFLEIAANQVSQDISNVIARIDPVLEKEQPDAVFFYGDTNTSMACIPVKRRKIPIFHMEAGNRCFDQRVPEELNRKVIDHLADINLTLTEHARRYLLAEGLRPETVIKVGSAMKEVLQYYQPKIAASTILKKLQLTPQHYFIVSAHREENVDSQENIHNFFNMLHTIAKHHNKKVIVSTHPRTQKRLQQHGLSEQDSRVVFMKPMGFSDYVRLQLDAFCVLSDSGTLTEEASLLNLPAVMLRQTHERPEGMDEATAVMSGLVPSRVLQAIELVTRQHAEHTRVTQPIMDFETVTVSRKVVRIIFSYIDYINRTVWSKPRERTEMLATDPVLSE